MPIKFYVYILESGFQQTRSLYLGLMIPCGTVISLVLGICLRAHIQGIVDARYGWKDIHVAITR